MIYVLIVLAVLAIIIVAKSITIIPQSSTKIIERLGRYHSTLNPGVNLIVPFIAALFPDSGPVQGRL